MKNIVKNEWKAEKRIVFTDGLFQRSMILSEVYFDSHNYSGSQSPDLYSIMRDKVI